jgi:DNA (cytosine-5)-methyltransferase 1
MIKVASDFSGVGAFNQALNRLGIEYKEVFACDMDKYARDTFILNYGEPDYYPTNVYDREIPKESLDIYMTSPPCQAFSLAGKRLGKDDKRGILFFNSHEFIKVNNPRYFIFENVKGLLSDDNGKTFQEWINMLGGKSVNGNSILFAHEDAVPYHVYWKVLNAKNFGVPQNRERVFIIGIRDDQDNTFRFPVEFHLTKRLKDVLENDVDDKYFLSEINNERLKETLKKHKLPNDIRMIDSYNKTIHEDSICISTRVNASSCTHLWLGNNNLKIGDYRTDEGFRWREDGNSPCIMASMRDKWDSKFTAQNPPIISNNYNIRRLTPRECFRLMDFPDSFQWNVSDSQAYKQAGNSIVVNVLYLILKNLNFES